MGGFYGEASPQPSGIPANFVATRMTEGRGAIS